MWVFGYGSLLWYTDFPYVSCIPGIVHGYSRRFWQFSPDHRGTPENPGNTVTLVPDREGSCWGLAYRIPDEHVKSAVDYLDIREKAGYERRQVEFHPDDGSQPFFINVYLAAVDSNPFFRGPLEKDAIVSTILKCRGSSGSNLEYALRLADCVRRLAPHVKDDHLFDIERNLLEKCSQLNIHDDILSALGHLNKVPTTKPH